MTGVNNVVQQAVIYNMDCYDVQLELQTNLPIPNSWYEFTYLTNQMILLYHI